MWSNRYLGVASVGGIFRDASVQLDLEGDDPRNWGVDVTIQAASLDSGYDRMDDHVRSADFLDVERFPTISFKSQRVAPAGKPAAGGPEEARPTGVTDWHPSGDRFEVAGELSLRGVIKPATLEVRYGGQATDARGRTRRAFSVHLRIKRGDFGISGGTDPERIVSSEYVDIDAEIIANKAES